MAKKKAILFSVPLACLMLASAVFAGVDGPMPKGTDAVPLQFAGLLDKLLDPKSKESKMLSGAVSILGSASEMDYKSERTIGESLALEGFRRYGLPVKDKALQQYVNLVGNAVARNSGRPNIPYNFVVVESPLQNAFSCPGGSFSSVRAC